MVSKILIRMSVVAILSVAVGLAVVGNNESENSGESLGGNGKYTAVGKGFGDADVTVTATMADGVFTNVAIQTEEMHPAGEEKQATDFALIEEAVLAASGTVDAVSSVTISISLAAVNSAVEDILTQAANGPGEMAAGGLTDGTYTAVGKGFGDAEVTVTVDVFGGAFSNVSIDTAEMHPSGEEKQAEDFALIEEAVLGASGTVDTVSSVTISISLAAVNSAVEEILTEASGS